MLSQEGTKVKVLGELVRRGVFFEGDLEHRHRLAMYTAQAGGKC